MPRVLAMNTISADEFDRLRARLPAVTKEGVMDTYRISQHSWYKLRDGKPVKQAVIDRMRDRYRSLTDRGEEAPAAGASLDR